MNLTRNARRLFFLIAFLVFAAHASMPASAVICGLGYDAPTGGGVYGPPITATGKISCAGLPGPGSVMDVYLAKDNVTVAHKSASVTGRSSVTVSLMASCSPGNWTVIVTATVPGGNVPQPYVVSDPVPIICGPGGSGPYSESPTMTSGYLSYPNAFYAGFSGAFGSMSPANTITGQTYRDFDDTYACSPYTGCYFTSSVFSVSGFSSDPGIGWLISVTGPDATQMGSTATYSYNSSTGTASWTWYSQPFGFVTGTVTVYLVHQ